MIPAHIANWTVLGFSIASLAVGFLAGRIRSEADLMNLGRQLTWMRRSRDAWRNAARRHGITDPTTKENA